MVFYLHLLQAYPCILRYRSQKTIKITRLRFFEKEYNIFVFLFCQCPSLLRFTSRIHGGHSAIFFDNDCHYYMHIRLEYLSLPWNILHSDRNVFEKSVSPCIRDRTMKMRTRTILAACFAIVTFNKFSTANVKVSSKVDLDSDENEEALSNATFDMVANANEYADPLRSISRASKPSTISWRHGSELVKPNEPRKRRIHLLQVSNKCCKEIILQITNLFSFVKRLLEDKIILFYNIN